MPSYRILKKPIYLRHECGIQALSSPCHVQIFCVITVYLIRLPYSSRGDSKESPPNEKQDEEADTCEWSVLAEQ
jgi:hypothetical protein